MPKAIKRKSKVQEREIDTEVQVRDTLAEFQETFRRKQKAIALYGGLSLLVVIALAGILLYQRAQQAKAADLEYRAYKAYHGLYQQGSEPERIKTALALFQQAYAAKKSGRTLLYIAACQESLGQPDEALKTLEIMTASAKRDADILPLAYQQTASIQMKKGDQDAALKTLDSLAHLKGMLQDYAIIESARILEKQGKKDEAASKYGEVVKSFPGSPYFEEAKAKTGIETGEEKKQ